MIAAALTFLRAVEGILADHRTLTIHRIDSDHCQACVSDHEPTGTSDYFMACTESTIPRAINRLAVSSTTDDEIATTPTNQALCEMMAKELVGHQANFYGGEEMIRQAFRKALAQEHRTIQQSFISALKLIIEDYDKDHYESHNYDGRNEFSVHWAHEVQSLNTKQGHLGHRFPCI